MKKIFAFFLLLTLFGGGCCWFLPSGDPPEGKITENRPLGVRQIKNPAQAMDYLISSLTVALLENCPGEKVQMGADVRSADLCFRVLHESSKISGNTITCGDSKWVLKSAWEKETLHLQLQNGGKAVWQEKISISFDTGTLR